MRGTSKVARIAELGLVGSMILSACVAPAGAVSQGDRSQDQAERTRSLIGMAARDTSYDQVEHSRGAAFSSAATDTSYDQVERTRGGQ